MNKKDETSWGGASNWYTTHLEKKADTYQRQVILPNVLRILEIKKGQKIIDIACGPGFFSRAFFNAGAKVTGVDISQELIIQAKNLSDEQIDYRICGADNLSFSDNNVYDLATIILALQNIEDMDKTLAEASRVLKEGGRLVLVLMHPAFRIPSRSSWGYDEKNKTQYRRIDGYLTKSKSKLLVHPSKIDSPITLSYHHSIQDLSLSLNKNDLLISRIEEWISDKKSQNGPRRVAEDVARTEIPLFMMIETKKITKFISN